MFSMYLLTRNRCNTIILELCRTLVCRKPKVSQTGWHVCAHVAIRDLWRIAATNCSFCDRYHCLLCALCAVPFSSARGFLPQAVVGSYIWIEIQGKLREHAYTCTRTWNDNVTRFRRLDGPPRNCYYVSIEISFLFLFCCDAHGKKH